MTIEEYVVERVKKLEEENERLRDELERKNEAVDRLVCECNESDGRLYALEEEIKSLEKTGDDIHLYSDGDFSLSCSGFYGKDEYPAFISLIKRRKEELAKARQAKEKETEEAHEKSEG